VLVELGLVEQRYQAVREVLNDGALVTDVARRRGVSRQTVHEWLVKYANHGLVGLMDRSSKPQSCPHQMSPEVEARIVELRTEHPGWGPPDAETPARSRGLCSRPRPDLDLSLPRAPRPRHAPGAPAQEGRLQALGAVSGDGTVANGCPRRSASW
jgi:transposase-like protein